MATVDQRSHSKSAVHGSDGIESRGIRWYIQRSLHLIQHQVRGESGRPISTASNGVGDWSMYGCGCVKMGHQAGMSYWLSTPCSLAPRHQPLTGTSLHQRRPAQLPRSNSCTQGKFRTRADHRVVIILLVFPSGRVFASRNW